MYLEAITVTEHGFLRSKTVSIIEAQ